MLEWQLPRSGSQVTSMTAASAAVISTEQHFDDSNSSKSVGPIRKWLIVFEVRVVKTVTWPAIYTALSQIKYHTSDLFLTSEIRHSASLQTKQDHEIRWNCPSMNSKKNCRKNWRSECFQLPYRAWKISDETFWKTSESWRTEEKTTDSEYNDDDGGAELTKIVTIVGQLHLCSESDHNQGYRYIASIIDKDSSSVKKTKYSNDIWKPEYNNHIDEISNCAPPMIIRNSNFHTKSCCNSYPSALSNTVLIKNVLLVLTLYMFCSLWWSGFYIVQQPRHQTFLAIFLYLGLAGGKHMFPILPVWYATDDSKQSANLASFCWLTVTFHIPAFTGQIMFSMMPGESTPYRAFLSMS